MSWYPKKQPSGNWGVLVIFLGNSPQRKKGYSPQNKSTTINSPQKIEIALLFNFYCGELFTVNCSAVN
jgi:hypothetical protein